MPETAESHIVSLDTNRVCVIEINNGSKTYCLCKPMVFLKNGFCHSPPTPTLRSNFIEVCSFTKDDHTASGTSGVMTYDLFQMARRCSVATMAVMFSVPFSYAAYKNQLGVGIFDLGTACNEDLFNQMYEVKDFTNFKRREADGSGLKYSQNNLDLRATMSDEGRAIIKLELYDSFTKQNC